MKRRNIIVISILALLCIIAILLYFLFRPKQNPNELTLYGNVDVRQVDIGFRVNGRVTKLFFEEGDKVPADTLMATLDKAPYDSQVKEAVANRDAIKANYDNAVKLLKRRQELIGIGGVSEEDLDNATASRDQLRANLLQAEAAIVVSKDNLSYTDTFAPTDGIILTRIREPGTVVLESEPVYTLISSPIWIRAFVDEPDLGRVHYGMKAKVYTDVKGSRTYEGKIGFISPVAEFTPKTVQTTELRTDLVYRLRIYVDNPNQELLQGMPVTVKIDTGQK